MPKPKREVELHYIDHRSNAKKLRQAYAHLRRWAKKQRSQRREEDEKGSSLCPGVDPTPRA